MGKPEEVKEEQKVAVNLSDLQSLITTILAEARKPAPPTEEELKKKEQADAERKAHGLQAAQNLQNEIARQNACTHKHWENGRSRIAYVQNGNFIICLACQKVIRPEENLQEFNQLIATIAPAIF